MKRKRWEGVLGGKKMHRSEQVAEKKTCRDRSKVEQETAGQKKSKNEKNI